MTTENDLEVHALPVGKIKKFISRAREKEGWKALRDTMADVGLKVPIEVRDIRHWPREARVNRHEMVCDYELVKGEGRLEAAIDLGWKTIPGFIKDAPEVEIVGRFLAENIIRTPLSWFEKGRLIADQLNVGTPFDEIVKRLHISENLASKYLRVCRKTGDEVKDDVAAMPVNDAEVLTRLPARGQKFVMEVVRETGAPVRDVAKRAIHLTASKGEVWTKAELSKALRRVDDELQKVKPRVKMYRMHCSIGPENIDRFLTRDAFRAAAKKDGILERLEEPVS